MQQDKEKEILFFDNFVEEKGQYIGLSIKSYKKLFFELTESLQLPNNNLKIIDLGCGTGTFTQTLLNISNYVSGCDISKKSIENAKKLNSKINYINGDIENLSLKNELFDIVVLSGVLHHFENPNRVLNESYRILKKGGIFFSFDPNLINPFFWLYRRKNSFFYSSKGVTENEQPITKKNIINSMKLANFNKINVYGISKMPFKYIDNKIFRILIPIYNMIDSFIDINPYIRNTYGSFLITKGFK